MSVSPLDSHVTAPQLREHAHTPGAAPLRVSVPDFRDASGMTRHFRTVADAYSADEGGSAGRWVIAFADDVPGNSSLLVTSATFGYLIEGR